MKILLTPKHVKQTLLVASGIGLSIGLSIGSELMLVLHGGLDVVITGLANGLGNGLSYGLSFGLLYWIVLGLFQGVKSTRIANDGRHRFNQGIRRSLFNGTLLALISSVLIGIAEMLNTMLLNALSPGLNSALFTGLAIELQEGLIAGLSAGLQVLIAELGSGRYRDLIFSPSLAICGGLLVFVSRGGLAVLRHYVIRLLLARSCTFPWHAVRFLDDATTRIFLRRVGGGYRFTHRLLLDYFADLDTTGASTSPLHTLPTDTSQSC